MSLFKKKNDDLTNEIEAYKNEKVDFSAESYVPIAATINSFPAQSVLMVENVFMITGRGCVVAGQVRQGTFVIGDPVEVVRCGNVVAESFIEAIEMFRSIATEATVNDNVGLLLRGLNKADIQSGDLICIR